MSNHGVGSSARSVRGRDEKAAALDVFVKDSLAKERAVATAKMNKLKELRLAKEISDEAAAVPAPPAPPKKKKPLKRAPRG